MLRFRLVTPERVLFDEASASVRLPTASGEITLLPHHAAMTALLKPGIVHLKTADGKETEVAVSDGFLNVTADGHVTALTETAERGEELELSVIEQAKARAEEAMKKVSATDDVSFAAAAAALERELARYKVAMKHRHGRNLPVADQARIKAEENEA